MNAATVMPRIACDGTHEVDLIEVQMLLDYRIFATPPGNLPDVRIVGIRTYAVGVQLTGGRKEPDGPALFQPLSFISESARLFYQHQIALDLAEQDHEIGVESGAEEIADEVEGPPLCEDPYHE